MKKAKRCLQILWFVDEIEIEKVMRNKKYKVYLQSSFLICVAVLAVAASTKSVVIKRFGGYLKKEPWPLKKSLDFLDENDLASYRVVSKEKISNKEVVKSLGTTDYIQWRLDDPDVSLDSSVRYCSLFITYYGLPDRVVHVPDECYMGSGYQRLLSDGVTFHVNKEGAEEKIQGRYVVFANTSSKHWGASTKFPILYLFNVNGEYGSSREDTRVILNKNLFGKHSYFCKIEWKFFNSKFGTMVYPEREEAVIASQKLLNVILPILEREHWPINSEQKN